jgi:cysteine desulfurase
VDVSHTLGKIPEAFSKTPADFYTFNGDQMYSPPGTGGIFFHEGTEMAPLIIGGNEQGGCRGGSFNLPAFIGMGKAAELVFEEIELFSLENSRLRDLLEEGIMHTIPGSFPHFKLLPRLPHVTAIHFPWVCSEALAFLLQRKNLFASLGGGNFQKIHYLLPNADPSSLCFALSRSIQEQDIHLAVETISSVYHHLRKSFRGDIHA